MSLCRARHCSTPGLPQTLALQLVEVQELDPPEGTDAIHWRLLTTHPVESADEAWQIVDWYRGRWRIEEYFRVLKKSGIDLEEAMVEGVHALINLVAMAAVVGVAGEATGRGPRGRPGAPCQRGHHASGGILRQALNHTLEGKTEKQKNPHQEGSPAWIAWIVARLGGWSGYQRYGPAGPKTMAYGWGQFKTMSLG